ncbi:hypothetical protein CONLIGDRAFT_673693 [Coniochaeta ligniaria NRRL 30616]|uniref:Uncharacterized protein n=1 Tax=Coniochaeta ligniaria NRRL 30616 TaxID=1408157 RepID=A0A1J7J3Y6_9PEZI|nr:hypothetical protein CONLIGDRAFT_673693 [Coniochaeta ligniaria NRRL 30616]
MDISATEAPTPERDHGDESRPSQAIMSNSLKPMGFPEDILHLIFTEFMCKPAIHFAQIEFRQDQETVKGVPLSLWHWMGGHVKSGYDASWVLSQTCRMARRALRHSLIEPSRIWFDSGSVLIDTATDIMCFVLPEKWDTPLTRILEGPPYIWTPRLDHKDITRQLGRVRRAGIMVTRSMWHVVLANWFSHMPTTGEEVYMEQDGRLTDKHLGGLMMCLPRLEAFYFVLTDVTSEDWDKYYSKFPISFHDNTAPYAQAYEEPIHHRVIDRLWCDYDHEYPYPATPNLDLDPTFPMRVDAHMGSELRVRLLMGLLDAARRQVQLHKPMLKIHIGVLARKPDPPPEGLASDKPRDPQPIPSDADAGYWEDDVGPNGSEANCVKQALDYIGIDSWVAYDEDRRPEDLESGEDDLDEDESGEDDLDEDESGEDESD